MKELFTQRFCRNFGNVGDGKGYSRKLSVKLLFEPRDIWVGIYWDKKDESIFVYICVVPCFPVRIHRRISFGGRFI